MNQTLNEQIAQSLQLYLDRGELTGDTFLARQESALQCLEQAYYETDKFDIQEAVTAWLYAKFEWDTCGDCGDGFDPTGPDVMATQFGDVRCADCCGSYYVCDICDDETHIDDTAGWEGSPVCNNCDELYGATCETCEMRCHVDSVEYCCKPRITDKP